MLKFGTDGVRGKFGTELTENYAANLAIAAVNVLKCSRVVVGRDTRESGGLIEAAIAKALIASGVSVDLMGVAPTPAIAFVAKRQNVVAFAITASHNLFEDNGIKIFGAGGRKLSDAEQEQIEAVLVDRAGVQAELADRSGVAKPELLQDYCDWLTELFRASNLSHLHIALDCANGAFSEIAPAVFANLGATVSTVNASPNGRNINLNCGATYPAGLSEVVKNVGAHFGIAFDGDGDRLIAVDSNGEIVDGDHILAISALEMKKSGALLNNKVAVTVMSNIGFHKAMKKANIEVVTTSVGDRSILLALEENELALGGEQSGHIIYPDLATTGDGLLAALKLSSHVSSSGMALSEIAGQAMTSFPQVLINLRLSKRVDDTDQLFKNEILSAEKTLGENGRVLVRASGTEPMVRVMVEASTQHTAETVAAALADAITVRLSE